MSKAIVRKGLTVVGKVIGYTGDTPTKKVGTGTAIYGVATLDPVTVGVGLALRFHDKADALVAKAKDILKAVADNAQAKKEIAKEQ